MMESDFSDVLSDIGSDVSEIRSEGEVDVAYKDDDEDYTEPPEHVVKDTKSSKRGKLRGKPKSRDILNTNGNNKRTPVDVLDEEDTVRRKRRHTKSVEISADEDDLDGDLVNDEEPLEGEEDEEADEENITSKAHSEDTKEETPDEDTTSVDILAEEDGGTGSMKPTRSKMLLNLLGDGSSRKSLTEEEMQLRRAENARKRKNLSEKRAEEEKQETINKLLRRRAGKSRSHIPNEDEVNGDDMTAFSKSRRPYNSFGMSRTIRKYDQDIYCTLNSTE